MRHKVVLVDEKTLLTLAPIVYMTNLGGHRLGGLPLLLLQLLFLSLSMMMMIVNDSRVIPCPEYDYPNVQVQNRVN